jgi:predicted nuclease of predicted toxin-antitoxin system
VTIDTDFGELVYVRRARHAGLVRLPDVPVEQRIALMAQALERHRTALETKPSLLFAEGVSEFPGRHKSADLEPCLPKRQRRKP